MITTISATAGSAAVQGDQAYGPYGNTRYQAGSMGTAKGFTGQYQDATGLDYYNARYYDPVVGRFISADTVEGNMQGTDPYAYVEDNPETHNDPTGRSSAGGCNFLFPVTCLPGPVGCMISPISCLVQVQIPAPPKVLTKWAIVAAAIAAIGFLIGAVLFNRSQSGDFNKQGQWTGACQGQILVDLSEIVRQERIVDQAKKQGTNKDPDQQTFGAGYLELVRNGQVVDNAELDLTKGHNEDPRFGAYNSTHSEAQTIENVRTWIQDHISELQTGDVIHLLIYTEIKPCDACDRDYQSWANGLKRLVKDLTNGKVDVTFILYIWYRLGNDTKDQWRVDKRPSRQWEKSPIISQ